MFHSLTIINRRTMTPSAKYNSTVQFQMCVFLSLFHLYTSGDESEHKQVLNNALEMLADHVSTSGALWIACFSRRAAIALSSGIKSVINCDCVSAASSNVTSRQKVEGPVLAAVGCLKLIPQAELPLVLQLQPDDGLTQGTSILANHAEGGACGCDRSKKKKKKVRNAQQQQKHRQ